MRRVMIALVLAGCSFPLFAQAAPAFVNTLMPEPAQLTAQQGSFALTASFNISLAGVHDDRLDSTISRTLHQLEMKTGLEFSHQTPAGDGGALVIDAVSTGNKIQSSDEDESYSLNITPQGAKLHAATVVGAMRGLATLVQLVQTTREGYLLPAVSIEDSPRFRWRGLMIDCGRHFEPIPVLERTLDGMAAVKLNVFHWHLTEDQGFRIESKIFPKLTGMGSDGLFYTQDQAKALVEYARQRGIRVVPEFDMPGHTTSWFVGYPELASAPGPYQIQRVFGVHDGAIDPTRESTYKFLDKFIGEMATIFPDQYMHIGGDESNGKQWKSNPEIQKFMQQHGIKDTGALQAYFNTRLLKIVEKHGKRMVGWDEVLNPGLPKDVTIQSWRGIESLSAGAKQGYAGILSAPYYLDAMKSSETHYLADPIPASSDLTPEQQKLILGGEICMWGEQLDGRTIDSRIWPRSAAIAERFWSPATVTNVDDMYRRLWVESIQLESLGLTHLTQQDAGLRELADSENIAGLHLLASVLEPVSFGERYHGQHTSQLTPLDRLVDAVRPDPPSRHTMNLLVRDFLKNPAGMVNEREQLNATFQQWLAATPELQRQMTRSPLLAEAQQRAQQLPGLATTGMEAVGYLSNGTKAPAGWKQGKLAILADAKKPDALVRFTVLDALTSLVNAVQEQ
ncbi:MAG: family 20 glycosylhydrolase [Acidobacteria bacterium]|nr:family 20 glycosylhydrolase [Acidobacteriota bacterium]MBW4044838.1 family 20 glycosylhydrolase [Acidobacteriota bacterium]